MELKRLLTNLCTDDLDASKSFYTSLFDFNVAFDSDWFVPLVSNEAGLELGIIARQHDIVPDAAKSAQSGFYLTLVIESVDALYDKALSMGVEIIQAPQQTFYGQKTSLVTSARRHGY